MEQLVIEHKHLYKKAVGYLLVAAVFVAMAIAVRDQLVLSVGSVITLVAFLLEFGYAIYTAIQAGSKEILDAQGLTMTNALGAKTYLWSDLERFEIRWDYEGKRLVKKEEIDAPYMLLKFTNTKKPLRFDYLEAMDQYIRVCYGEPHRDDWTNLGK